MEKQQKPSQQTDVYAELKEVSNMQQKLLYEISDISDYYKKNKIDISHNTSLQPLNALMATVKQAQAWIVNGYKYELKLLATQLQQNEVLIRSLKNAQQKSHIAMQDKEEAFHKQLNKENAKIEGLNLQLQQMSSSIKIINNINQNQNLNASLHHKSTPLETQQSQSITPEEAQSVKQIKLYLQDISNLQASNEIFKEKLSKARGQISGLKDKNESLTNQLKEQAKSLQNLNNEYENVIRILKQKDAVLGEYEKTIAELEYKIDHSYKGQLQFNTFEMVKLQKEVAELKEAERATETKYVSKIDNMDQMISQLQAQIIHTEQKQTHSFQIENYYSQQLLQKDDAIYQMKTVLKEVRAFLQQQENDDGSEHSNLKTQLQKQKQANLQIKSIIDNLPMS